MNNNRFQSRTNNNNYRNVGDSRRGNYHNNGYRKDWGDRSRVQYDCRPDSRIGIRNDSGPQTNQSTHLPGIAVNRNQSSTPFVASDPKVDNCANGSGDKISEELPLNSLSNQLSQIDLCAKDSGIDDSLQTCDTKEVIDSSSPPEVPKESQPESVQSQTNEDTTTEKMTSGATISQATTNGTTTGANTTVGSAYVQRRNTIGTEYGRQNYRSYNRAKVHDTNLMNGQRFTQLNKMPANDPNKKFTNYNNNHNNNRGGFKKFGQQKTDFISNNIQLNPYQTPVCEPYPPYYFPNPYYPTNHYRYGGPTPMMAPNGGEMTTDLGNRRKQLETDRTIKVPDQNSSEANGYTHFVRYEPSPAIPVPPVYYGTTTAFYADGAENGGNGGLIYYFNCMMPPNIAPLRLDVDQASGAPILPSNCINIYPSYLNN